MLLVPKYFIFKDYESVLHSKVCVVAGLHFQCIALILNIKQLKIAQCILPDGPVILYTSQTDLDFNLKNVFV